MSSNFWNDNGRQKQEKYGKVQLELSTWIKSCNPGQCAQFIKNLDIHFCTLLSPHMSWLILKKERQYTQISLYFIAEPRQLILWKCEGTKNAPGTTVFEHNAQQLVVTSTHTSRPILVGLPEEKQSPNHPIHPSPTAMILSSSAFSTNRFSLELDFSQNLNGFCAWNRRLLAPAKVQADCYGIDVVRSLWVAKSCIDSIAKAEV